MIKNIYVICSYDFEKFYEAHLDEDEALKRGCEICLQILKSKIEDVIILQDFKKFVLLYEEKMYADCFAEINDFYGICLIMKTFLIESQK